MESFSSKRAADAQKQTDLKRQIAELQAQLKHLPDEEGDVKDEPTGPAVVVPATPSPKKKRKIHHDMAAMPPIQPLKLPQTTVKPLKQKVPHARPLNEMEVNAPPPSSLISQLGTLTAKPNKEAVIRSNAFEEKPVELSKPHSRNLAPERDDQLALVEELEPGPVDHKPLAEDPEFEKVEPNSGIRLSSRTLSHEDIQNHLTGRYFLPPSLLYSVARLTPDKQAYDVPVEGDWVTIAVVAERGEIKLTNPGPNGTKDDEEEEEGVDGGKKLKNGKPPPGKLHDSRPETEKEDYSRKRSKKFIHIKLVDLGHGSRSSSNNSSTSRGALRGDAQLNLLLFESDSFDVITDDVTRKLRKAWKGGSGGAFEECLTKLREGTVIALLNPKVLRPFQNMKNPSSSHVLALTPPSASAIAIIGRARDLGMCSVRKRDGKVCGAWVDRRIAASSSSSGSGDVCEYHLQSAVQRARAGRAEFSVGTSGMSTTAKKQRGNKDYDPSRNWGLQPSSSTTPGGEAVYIIGGHVASSSSHPLGALAPGKAAENIGREGQARAKRRADERDSEIILKELLGREKSTGFGGGAAEVVKSARALIAGRKGQKLAANEGKDSLRPAQMKGKGKAREDSSTKGVDEGDNVPKTRCSFGTINELEESKPKRGYGAEMVKRLGFDPASLSAKIGTPQSQSVGKKPLKPLPERTQSGTIHLGPPPGKRIRSGVTIPPEALKRQHEHVNADASSIDFLTDSSTQNERTNSSNKIVDEDSDSELEFETSGGE